MHLLDVQYDREDSKITCWIKKNRVGNIFLSSSGAPHIHILITGAGWLGYRGALQLVTRSTGTIIIPNDIRMAETNRSTTTSGPGPWKRTAATTFINRSAPSAGS